MTLHFLFTWNSSTRFVSKEINDKHWNTNCWFGTDIFVFTFLVVVFDLELTVSNFEDFRICILCLFAVEMYKYRATPTLHFYLIYFSFYTSNHILSIFYSCLYVMLLHLLFFRKSFYLNRPNYSHSMPYHFVPPPPPKKNRTLVKTISYPDNFVP